MDPALSLASVKVLTQALLVRPGLPLGDVEVLVKAVGQELAVRYLGQGAEGARLELPGGRVITAQGEVPFPEGTQMRVRVAREDGALKLQTLEATPPKLPGVLAPLVHGEAASLAAQLQQTAPPLELAPLVNLLRILMEGPEVAAPALPTAEMLAQAIARLPKSLAASLAQALGAGLTESPAALAQRILSSLAQAGKGADVGSAKELLTLLQNLLKNAEIPQESRAGLETWARNLAGEKANPAPQNFSDTQGSRILSQGDMTKVAEALKTAALAPSEVPEVWEAWVKGTVRALADPELSPREAPFHALQAKENTAFFEIPLPWAGGKALQLWVEGDAPGAREPDPEAVTRVLMGFSFTRLGETRVGLQRSSAALSVRIWTEHPELVEAHAAQIEQELQGSAITVDLRILQLSPGLEGGIPDLRALVMGRGSVHTVG